MSLKEKDRLVFHYGDNFMNKFRWILLIVACSTITGCIEEKSEFTLNPDGSGKVVYETTIQPIGYRRREGAINSQVELYRRIEGILTDSAGIDAWKDVSYKFAMEGNIYFKGTAYFPDISKLDIYNNLSGSHMIRHTANNKNSEIVINIESRKLDSSEEKESEEATVELSEAELNKQIKKAKLEYNQSNAFEAEILSPLKLKYILHLPGTIKEVSNFQKIDNRTVRLELSGDKINNVKDEIMNDEDMLRKQIREGKDTTDYIGDDLVINEKFFGQKAPIQVVVASGHKHLFDYDSEVSFARKNYKKMISQLGLEAVIAERDAEVLIPKIHNVIKLEKHFEFEDELCSLSMSVKLPRKAISVGDGNDWDMVLTPDMKANGRSYKYEVTVLMPDKQKEILKEVSGDLYYFTATGCRKFDLGIMDFKAGSKSKEAGFSIRELKVYEWDKNSTILVLELNLPKGAIKSYEFYNEQGDALKVFIGSKMTSNDPLPLSNFYFKIRGNFPPRGRIVLDVWDGVKKHKVGFKAIDVPLGFDKPDKHTNISQ